MNSKDSSRKRSRSACVNLFLTRNANPGRRGATNSSSDAPLSQKRPLALSRKAANMHRSGGDRTDRRLGRTEYGKPTPSLTPRRWVNINHHMSLITSKSQRAVRHADPGIGRAPASRAGGDFRRYLIGPKERLGLPSAAEPLPLAAERRGRSHTYASLA